MNCRHAAWAEVGVESAFTVDASRVTFGRGCLREVGARTASHLADGNKRVALFTDARLRRLETFATVEASLRAAALDVVVYDEVHVEPTDASFQSAARFATDARVDAYVSFGGGSVIDTAKAANLYATCPADFAAYVNAPVGEGRAVPRALRPHIACPTTSGTGSEVTGITIFDYLALKAKTGIASPRLRPTEALVDPDVTATLPPLVVAASGMDVLSHALESFTARPYTSKKAPATPLSRPMSQGTNPWSDLGCREALRLLGVYLERAVHDAADHEAREQVMWAATLAGIAFGNAGVHVPHGMAYAVAGLVRDYRPAGYPDHEPMVPHGISVIVNAPAVFRALADTSPARHLQAAACLGADTGGAAEDDAGEVVAGVLLRLMKSIGIPNGVGGVGYHEGDIAALVAGTLPQKRVLDNAPCPIDGEALASYFRAALSYW